MLHGMTEPTKSAQAVDLSVDLAGLALSNPVMTASGTSGNGPEYADFADVTRLGAFVTKAISVEPRKGNPPERTVETRGGMLNAIGLQNPGVDAVVEDILPTLDFAETRFIANVCGSTIDEYVAVTRRFDQSAIDAMELNISCPNVKAGGAQFGNDPDMSAKVVAACRSVTSKPLITKLSPNQTDIAENARRCIEAGTDALSAINTVVGMALDIRGRKPILGNVQGGLSGPAIKPIALHSVREVYRVAAPHGIPIIGQGGLVSVTDAIEFLLAGASAVGVGTALFYDPLVCREINAGLTAHLLDQGLRSPADLVGKLDLERD